MFKIKQIGESVPQKPYKWIVEYKEPESYYWIV